MTDANKHFTLQDWLDIQLSVENEAEATRSDKPELSRRLILLAEKIRNYRREG